MEQPGLFDPPPPQTRARRDDPETSHAAARKVSALQVSHYHRILAALATPGNIYDVAARSGLNHVQVARRLPELHAMKPPRAEPTEDRKEGCRVWRKVPV